MAVWLATAGCGVGLDHVNHENKFIASFFTFHVYYQIRKCLYQMGCPLPGDPNFNEYDNKYSHQKYKELLTEFNLPDNPDFRYRGSDNKGLGTMYFNGHPIHGTGYIDHIQNYALPDENITSEARYHTARIQKLVQNYSKPWASFMLKESEGFTKAGIIRLNDTIRTYVYALLGAQAQVRRPIIGTGTALDAQKQFLVIMENTINQMHSLPDMIKRYEDAITQTHARLNFALSPDLYLLPGNLVFDTGTIVGYNNNIRTATPDMKFGLNLDINADRQVHKMVPKLSNDQSKVIPINKHFPAASKTPQSLPPIKNDTHDTNKVYLALGLGTIVGLCVTYFKS